ncbi:hypothetical protein [Plantactinospora sp. KBS50]|nr:hypothetical protein [Plantactinospora sp. KBS50]
MIPSPAHLVFHRIRPGPLGHGDPRTGRLAPALGVAIPAALLVLSARSPA